ncbi:MAG: CoA transferase [Phreatobacter sp.]|uniref:CoA transferase subunit A n=1 Tax=Phreatobacter sp. TaxID=1966341 RepID=UPI0027330BD3|nr:CoA transferase [Phreatobacter sp.]MDP2800547.1 CoA transferase [Phreatobacter sp.]
MQTHTLDDLARMVPDGAKLALPVDYAGVSMVMTRPLIARGLTGLHVVCLPTGGMQPDMLIGAGCVATIETSAMTLGEAGGAPCFSRAVREGSIRVMDATCPAVHAGFLAAQKGVPFATLRGMIGTDVLANRPDWKVIQNPFSQDPDPIVAIPAIRPDVTIFHCPMADRDGNVWIGRRRELASLAYASERTLVTVERIVDTSLLADEVMAAGVLPALYVEAVAVAPRGAAPIGLWGEYPADMAEIGRYAREARTPEGFRAWLDGADRALEAVS